ncbi:MAG: flagellar hook-length control protein FliK [Steroidobacteraceae bacterium]|nr:flagellar hook-length control protein FliK [Steroidobacteraceae bacterium]MDW8260096.1 flagellar hook-length control protein FliK [Gammaproteobacteria bacterium]
MTSPDGLPAVPTPGAACAETATAERLPDAGACGVFQDLLVQMLAIDLPAPPPAAATSDESAVSECAVGEPNATTPERLPCIALASATSPPAAVINRSVLPTASQRVELDAAAVRAGERPPARAAWVPVHDAAEPDRAVNAVATLTAADRVGYDATAIARDRHPPVDAARSIALLVPRAQTAEETVRGDDALTASRGEAPATAAWSAVRALAAASSAPAVPAAPPAKLATPVGREGWAAELGQRVLLQIERGEQVAVLRVEPEELGPLEVRVTVRDNEAAVRFVALHPETRQALEYALPKLRELLATAGIGLGQTFVTADQSPASQQESQSRPSIDIENKSDLSVTTTVRVGRGLVDTYA